MNGITSQLLSLITFGNQYLKTNQLTDNYYPANTVFKFCNTVDFMHLASHPDGTTTEKLVAGNPNEWFKLLKQESCRELKAYYHPTEGNNGGTPDHKMAGFVGGGGNWLIEAIYPSYSDFWAARWQVTRPDDPAQNLWSVNYGRTVHQTETINFRPDTNEIRKGLQGVLNNIKLFAEQQKLSNWAIIFDKALQVLQGKAPADEWLNQQISKEGYEAEDLQLVYAAMTAHVFGGMGSWNDLGFEKPEDNARYEDLSFRLYDYINRALIGGINAIK
ncbi:hypothetical protein [Mucilaginibacter sp. CSA2-8R]|uniref:hypothetical protein n=1 Tax=Mucilaginibacter sp. CSA2-8R TaxID=3141542 RepID=UPI00315CE035